MLAANWLRSELHRFGADVQLGGCSDVPIVYARINRNKPRTLLVYGMYERPATSRTCWGSPPFEAGFREMSGVGSVYCCTRCM